MDKPHTTFDLADGDLHMAILAGRVLERALRFRVFDSWVTRDDSLEELVRLLDAEILYESQSDDTQIVVLRGRWRCWSSKIGTRRRQSCTRTSTRSHGAE